MDLKLFAEILLGLLVMAILFAIWCDQRYSRRILLPKITEKPMFMALRVPPCEDGETVGCVLGRDVGCRVGVEDG